MDFTWQDLAALLLVLAAVGYVVRRLRQFGSRKGVAACSGCSGCAGAQSKAPCGTGAPPVVLHQLTSAAQAPPIRL
jgi:hypothetical protein